MEARNTQNKEAALQALRQECANCAGCPLGDTRTNLVFGVGTADTGLLFVGEGPGEQEDLQGEPFVGPAGHLLDDMLSLIDLDRSRVYIANIVKCRPPHNRDPREEEREACLPWLRRQIEILDPKLVVCLGRIAAVTLIRPDFRITRERGQWFDVDGRRLLATYHPSFLLRDPSKRPEAFTDFQAIRAAYRELDEDYLRRSTHRPVP